MTYPSSSTLVAIAVVYGLLFASLRRPATAGAMTLYVLGFVLLSSFMKQVYLGMAMTLADMHFFLLRPAENFHLFVHYPVLGITLAGVLIGAILCMYIGLKFEKPRGSGWLRATTAAASFAVGVGASLIASESTQARANDGDAYAAFLSMYEQLHPGGPIGRLNVFFNNRSFQAVLPAKREQKRFTTEDIPPAAPPTNPDMRPDIVLVLEESTFDPTLIRACSTADCENSMFDPVPNATRTRQGPLLVHTTGGGTWLAEFAIMSGLDWRVFGRGGAFAPVSLAPRLQRSLPLQLRNLGYRTVAVYPTDGNFLSARSAYDYYGFEEFYDARDLKLSDDWQAIYDRMIFDKALQLSRRETDPRPVFLFVLTIRNHGPHGGDKVPVPKEFHDIEMKTTPALADYLARTRLSSQDFTAFARTWLSSSHPRVIAWFGDHQPEAAWDYTERLDLLRSDRVATNVGVEQLKYLTYYQLSANFGAPQRQFPREALDVSYLGTELVSFAELPQTADGAATLEVAAACKGLMIDCADRALINDYLAYRIYDLGAVK